MMRLENGTEKDSSALKKKHFLKKTKQCSRATQNVLHTDFLLQRGNSWKLSPGESVLSGEESPVWSLEPGEQPRILYDTELQ